MARANPTARKLLADAVAPVVKAQGGAPKVSEKVGRHRSTVTRWVKGDIDWDGLVALASGTRTDIVITFPGHGQPRVNAKEALRPEWAEGLERKLDVLLARAGVDPDKLDDSERTRLVREALARASSSQQSGGGAPPVLP